MENKDNNERPGGAWYISLLPLLQPVYQEAAINSLSCTFPYSCCFII